MGAAGSSSERRRRGQADRRRRQVIVKVGVVVELGRVADRDRLHRRRGVGRRPLDPQLGEVDLVDRGDPLDRSADREVAVRAAVHLAAGGVGVARPDELLADHRPTAGRAARRIELLDVLAQRHVDAPRGGELPEGGLDRGRVRREQECLAGELGERAGIADHRAHPGGDGPARRPAGAGPRIEDGVAGTGERGELGVQLVIGRRGEVALQEREAGEAARKDDVVETLPLGLAHRASYGSSSSSSSSSGSAENSGRLVSSSSTSSGSSSSSSLSSSSS